MEYFLYLLILALIAIPVALIWVCMRTSVHQRELEKLRREIDKMAAEVYGRREGNGQSPPVSVPSAVPPAVMPPPVQVAPPIPYPVPQPVRSPAPYQAAPPTYPVPPPASIYPPARPVAPAPVRKRGNNTSLENWLGRNVLGIAASVLVFIGLIFLGVLVYKYITETVKILLMYALSGIITGLGAFLSAKGRNNFTLALTGCGCGCFFISILLTHIYFGRLPDFAAFGLLLVWMAATLVISRWQRSTLLSVVAHAGMIISLCFAFAQGISDDKLLLVLLYQGAASAVMLVGNIFCCRKTYHFGLFASLGLTLAASGFMLASFVPGAAELPFRSALPASAVAAAFAVQFLMASFFSYLLAVSASRFKDEDTMVWLHVLNKLLWTAALCMNVYVAAYRLALPHFTADTARAPAAGIAWMVCLVPLAIHVALTLAMRIKLRFSETLECLSVLLCFLLAVTFQLLFWNARAGIVSGWPRLPWLILPALALFLIRRFSRRAAYLAAADLLLGVDFLFLLFGGYGRLTRAGTPALALAYLLLLVIVIAGQWYFQNPAVRQKNGVLLRVVLYLVVVLSLLPILLAADLAYPEVTLLLVMTGLHFLLLLLRYDRGEDGGSLRWLLGAAALVLLAMDAGFIGFARRGDPVEGGLYFLLSGLAFFLAFVRAPALLYDKEQPAKGVVTGISLTLLVLATVQGNTDWFSQSYILSLTCMLTALACILTGFAGKISSLRFYGLILTLVCVLKLVTLDVMNLSTLLRVVALIGGGVICFIVSAMYNYTVRQLKKAEPSAEEPPVDSGPRTL